MISSRSMQDAVSCLVGKQIAHVLVKSGEGSPRSQLFLVFSDGTYYEFYSCEDAILGAGRLDSGGLDAARSYMPNRRVVVEA